MFFPISIIFETLVSYYDNDALPKKTWITDVLNEMHSRYTAFNRLSTAVDAAISK